MYYFLKYVWWILKNAFRIYNGLNYLIYTEFVKAKLSCFFPLVHRVTSKWLFTVEIPTWGPIETSTFSHTFHETIANVWRFSCSLKGCRSSVYVEVSRVIRFPRVCLARRCFCRCRKGNVWNSLFLWSLSYVHQQCGEWCPFFISFFFIYLYFCVSFMIFRCKALE